MLLHLSCGVKSKALYNVNVLHTTGKNFMNKKRFALTIISILLILPISFIFANMSEAALTYSVRRGDVLIGAFVVLVCILIRFGLDRVIVRLIEEEQEKEAEEEAGGVAEEGEASEVDTLEVEEVSGGEETLFDVDEQIKKSKEKLLEESEENSDNDIKSDTEAEIDSEEEIEDYDEKEGSIIGSLFKNIIIYVIAATLLVVLLFLYSIEWISLVLALTGIIFISIVLLEKNIYRKRSVTEQMDESEELDDEIDEKLDEESVDKSNDESVENNDTKLVDEVKSDDVNKTEIKDDVTDSEKTEEIADKGKKKKRNRKRNRTVADRIKSIRAEEKIINVEDNGIELTFVETKITDSSDEPSNNKTDSETKNEKVKNKPTEEDNKKDELEFINVGSGNHKESTDVDNKEEYDNSSDVEDHKKTDNKENNENIEIVEDTAKEAEPDKEDLEKNDIAEVELDSENIDVTEKKEKHVGKIVSTAILQTIAYLLPIILVLLVFGDLQAKRFTGPYFMLIIILSILAAGIEVAASNMPGNKVAYIITSIFLTLFLCHRSILIGLVFLLDAYLILVIVPISYDNWGTGGTKAVNRVKISMSRLVSRVFTLIMIVLAVWQLSYGAMWGLDYLVIMSVAVSSIGYMADRHY